MHAVVARSTFPSQNVQSAPRSDRFWKLRCRKSARRCGAKLISKSKCTKHTMLGPVLEVEMSKRCTPVWRKAHFEVKRGKTDGFGALLDVRMLFCVAGAREYAPLPKVSKTFCSSFNYNYHYTTLHYTPLHYSYNYNYITLHYITLHSAPLHSQLHYTTTTTTTATATTTTTTPTRHDTTLHFHYRYNYNYNYTTLHDTTRTRHDTTLH